MSLGKVEVPAFDGKGNFNLWSRRIRALMSHNKVLIALEPKAEKWSEDQKKRKSEIDEEATNLLVLSLADNVLRKVDSCYTPLDIWKKLESLYSNQLAPNLAYVKASLFGFKMDPTKSIDENLDEVMKMTTLLAKTSHMLLMKPV